MCVDVDVKFGCHIDLWISGKWLIENPYKRIKCQILSVFAYDNINIYITQPPLFPTIEIKNRRLVYSVLKSYTN